MNVLDLFSGIGGFSLGLERTGGFETVAFCEIEPYCQAVLRKHWPEVPVYDDVRKLTVGRLAADGIYPDVICGGFPCQDISVAGKGEGIEGERSGLWSEFARIIGEFRPCYAIVENVAALLSRGMGVVLGDLASLGYAAEWHCIPASAVGAPHRRDRVWVVAYPDSPELRQQPGRRSGAHGPGSTEPGDNGSSRTLANSDGRRASQHAGGQPDFGLGLIVRGETLANAGGGRRDRAQGREVEQPRRTEAISASEVMAHAYQGDKFGRRGSLQMGWGRFASEAIADGNAGGTQWCSESDVGRVAHGIPRRVDRLGALGNAVVPQIPELIGRAILATEDA